VRVAEPQESFVRVAEVQESFVRVVESQESFVRVAESQESFVRVVESEEGGAVGAAAGGRGCAGGTAEVAREPDLRCARLGALRHRLVHGHHVQHLRPYRPSALCAQVFPPAPPRLPRRVRLWHEVMRRIIVSEGRSAHLARVDLGALDARHLEDGEELLPAPKARPRHVIPQRAHARRCEWLRGLGSGK
jgi:hypothetical protein